MCIRDSLHKCRRVVLVLAGGTKSSSSCAQFLQSDDANLFMTAITCYLPFTDLLFHGRKFVLPCVPHQLAHINNGGFWELVRRRQQSHRFVSCSQRFSLQRQLLHYLQYLHDPDTIKKLKINRDLITPLSAVITHSLRPDSPS